MESWLRSAVLVVGIGLGGVCLAAEQQVALSGWFHVIWNGGPQFMLIDDQGGSTRLLLDETLARPFGGPLALNRKRVRIVGERLMTSPGAIRVLSVEFEIKE